jgi:hypothetical protein
VYVDRDIRQVEFRFPLTEFLGLAKGRHCQRQDQDQTRQVETSGYRPIRLRMRRVHDSGSLTTGFETRVFMSQTLSMIGPVAASVKEPILSRTDLEGGNAVDPPAGAL